MSDLPSIDFRDKYGVSCSLQESSLAGEACVWLGVTNPKIETAGAVKIRKYTRGEAFAVGPDEVLYAIGRMHLTQDAVAKLIPHLQQFVETGFVGSEQS